MHLKNFSLISNRGKVELSPVYDLLNTSIVLRNPKEEMAMPIRGKKSNLTRKDLVEYFCCERCGLAPKAITELLAIYSDKTRDWPEIIQRSFLSETMQDRYLTLLEKRLEVLL